MREALPLCAAATDAPTCGRCRDIHSLSAESVPRFTMRVMLGVDAGRMGGIACIAIEVRDGQIMTGSMAMENLLGSIVWHELMTTDVRSAAAFFSKVAGWTAHPWSVDNTYTMFVRQNRQIAGLMGLPDEARAMGTPPCWMTYIATPDVDATARQAVALGGTVHKSPQEIPTVGRFAIIGDPQGAFFVGFTPAGPAQGKSTDADFSWHELATSDIDAAFDFYERLFGWERTDTYHGPMGRYQTIGHLGRTFGGISQRPMGVPGGPGWLPYISIKDAQASARVITAIGGRVSHGPMQVPGGGWIVQGTDPQGAIFAVYAQSSGTDEIDAMKEIEEAAAASHRPAATKVAKKVAKKAVKKAVKKVAKKAVHTRNKQAEKPAIRKLAKKPVRKSVAKAAAKSRRKSSAKSGGKTVAKKPAAVKSAAKQSARRTPASSSRVRRRPAN